MEGTKIQVGKGSLVFLEAAAELDNVVLTNKSYQTTRFVMATLRGMSTYMTNLPTLYAIHSQTLQECLKISDNTGAKSCMETIKNIGNGEKIAMMIGICQLLELYSKCSLSAQHAKKFPTSVLEDAVHLTNQLERLSEAWVCLLCTTQFL